MKHLDTRWIPRLLAASCLGTALLATPAIGAAEEAQEQTSILSPSKDDLLMFWDEKELYVQTATRSDKPINQVAENMTVITAKEIEAMNANSVNEVLARVPGVFAMPADNDFSSSSALTIQGSQTRHVTVLLDGMPINTVSDGNAITSFIPIRIVERIEIIKGAASSAWGSGLGGVINIITHNTGDNATPKGMFGVSWGKAGSRNGEAELNGKNGPVGYYLYAGQQGSDGLVNSRDYQRSSVFTKLLLTPTRDLDITLTGGFSNPAENQGDIPAFGMRSKVLSRFQFLNSSVEYRATPELTVRGGLYLFKDHIDIPSYFLADNSLIKETILDEQRFGANLRATWSSGIQTVTVGGEANRSSKDQTTNFGPLLQSPPLIPATFAAPGASVERWGIFSNDTIEFGPLAVTPGIRLDHDNITGYFVSPSLGGTLELGEHTVARASAARGFTSPPLGYTKGGGLFFIPNPNLKTEYGWSYQAGLESGLADLVNLKGTLFHHDTSNAIVQETTTRPYSSMFNRDSITRQGYELEADTVPYHNVSLKLGHAYAHTKGETIEDGYSGKSYDTYSWLVGLKYDDRTSFTAQLNGSYVYWNLASTMPFYADPAYDTFIWDFTATKKFRLDEQNSLEAFFSVHNIFSGDYYTNSLLPNPGRWVEGGVRFNF